VFTAASTAVLSIGWSHGKANNTPAMYSKNKNNFLIISTISNL
jgi:hypothetical protein